MSEISLFRQYNIKQTIAEAAKKWSTRVTIKKLFLIKHLTFREQMLTTRPWSLSLVLQGVGHGLFNYSLSGLVAIAHRAMSKYTGRVTTRKTPKNAAMMNHHGAPPKMVPPKADGKPIASTTINDIMMAIMVHTAAITCFVFIVISNTFTSSSLKCLLWPSL